MGGRRPEWTDKPGEKLVRDLRALLEATPGLTYTEAIKTLCMRPPWNIKYSHSPSTLLRKYRVAQRHHDAQSRATEEDRCMSMAQKWGMSPENARELVDRLITLYGLPVLGRLFDYVSRRRVYPRPRKVKWLQHTADEKERNPDYWPFWRKEPPDTNAERIKTVLRRAPRAANSYIAAETGMKLRTVETLLYSMRQTDEVISAGFGKHVLPAAGIVSYVPPSTATMKVLEDGSATPAEICARTGMSKSQIAGALHWLWKHEKIVRIRPNLWGLPGTALPYVYAHDAVIEVLQSGSKTVRELVAATGRNRGQIWGALRRLKAKGYLIEAYLVHGSGQRGRCAAFALSARGHRAAVALSGSALMKEAS
jgi:hypothetical protein